MLSKVSRFLALSPRELFALCAIFALTLPAVTPRIYASDEIQYFAYLRSLWFDRDVSFENEYRYFYERNIGRGEGFHATFLELWTDAGLRPNFGTLGAALLWAPFYAAGDLAARAQPASDRPDVADGFSTPYIAAVAYGSAFYGFAAIVLGVAAARRALDVRTPSTPHDSRSPATLAAGPGSDVISGIVVWLGTPLAFYMYVAPPYAHAPSAFAVALFVIVWLHVRVRWSAAGAAGLGACAALMAMVREQDAFLAIGPALDFLLTSRDGTRAGRIRPLQAVTTATIGILTFALAFLPQLIAYHALNGYPGPSRLVARKMSWHSPHALQVLGSPEHGFLFWTPLALVALGGFLVIARTPSARRIAGLALLMIALQVYVSGSVDSWTVAGAFGQRRFVALTALLIVGVAAAFRAVPAGASRLALGAAVVVCVWWNLALMAAFGSGLMNRQRLELARNVRTAFVTIPRMAPELAVRYLTERESFYQRRN